MFFLKKIFKKKKLKRVFEMNRILFLLFIEIIKRDLKKEKAEKFLLKTLQRKIKKDKLKEKIYDEYQSFYDKHRRP